MADANNLIGQKFNKLLVIGGCIKEKGFLKVLCRCDCGKEKYIEKSKVVIGKTKSCGCFSIERLIERNSKHGMRYTRLYDTWRSMKKRCNNINNKNYGGRGVSYCSEWEKFEPFKDWAFLNGWNESDLKISLDRIDPNGNYEPFNCRFTDNITQQNNKRNNTRLRYDGLNLTVAQWSKKTGINVTTILQRIALKWDTEKILSFPVDRPLKQDQVFVVNGVEKTIKEWCEWCGIGYDHMKRRIKRGQSLDSALTTKARQGAFRYNRKNK